MTAPELLPWIADEASRGLSEGDTVDALTAIKWKVKDHLAHAQSACRSRAPEAADAGAVATRETIARTIRAAMMPESAKQKHWSLLYKAADAILALLASPTAAGIAAPPANYGNPHSAWRPIETAPRDETSILATGGGLDESVQIVRYLEHVGAWETSEVTLDDRDNEADGYSRPLYWMPLPEAPGTSCDPEPAAAPPAASADAVITDDALWTLASALHSNVPENDRPMSWSDYSPEQVQRLRCAAEAFVAATDAPVAGDDAGMRDRCAKIANQTALRCVREGIPGDSAARFIERAIRDLPESAGDGTDHGGRRFTSQPDTGEVQ